MHLVDIWDQMRNELAVLSDADLLRRPATLDSPLGPTVVVDGREVLCLCGNDYLALASDESVKAAAISAVRRWGVGTGSSRLICGTTAGHVELEKRLAAFKNLPAAVVTSTGWMANRVAIYALAGKGDIVLCDKLDHASILAATHSCGATMRVYPHRDVGRLERMLDRMRGRYRRCLIVTDSLFSMDGDLAPLAELADLKERFDAQLLIDEAHATGVLGAHGRGAAELGGVEERIDAVVGTLSKALGAMGGFVAGPQVLIETIRNTGRAYIYTTAPPAAICTAVLRALEIVETQPDRRRRLLDMSADLRERLKSAGLDTRDSQSQIIPVVIGNPSEAVDISRRLLEAGFLVPAIRPPSVPRGTSRLRVSLSAAHEPGDLERFAETLIVCAS